LTEEIRRDGLRAVEDLRAVRFRERAVLVGREPRRSIGRGFRGIVLPVERRRRVAAQIELAQRSALIEGGEDLEKKDDGRLRKICGLVYSPAARKMPLLNELHLWSKELHIHDRVILVFHGGSHDNAL
jgi:hypothetical protein